MLTTLDDGTFLIGDHNADALLAAGHPAVTGGPTNARGAVPRDWTTHPAGCYRSAPHTAVDIPLVPADQVQQRWADAEAAGATLEALRETGAFGRRIPSRDQNGKGYCWAHSSTTAMLCVRAAMRQPYADLSAYAVACVIKNYRDEGGWGAQSLDFIAERGVPTAEFWPQQSMSRANDNARTWANAALHKMTEGWVDSAAPQYDRNLAWAQIQTLYVSLQPVVSDFNWWSHSVCGIGLRFGAQYRRATRGGSGKLLQLHEFDRAWATDHPVTAGAGNLIWNSWGDGWSKNGTGVLTGSKAIPDGSVAPRAATASVN